jgi:hypothetical protein
MNWFKRLFKAGRCEPGISPPHTEPLESRTHFSTGPTLVGEGLLGSAQAVTGIVLTFNQPLDPATAQNVNAYSIGRHVTSGSSSNLLNDLGGLFFTARPGGVARPGIARPDIVLHPARKGVHGGRVAFTSAIYDDATMSVTLTPAYPIKATKFFRYIHVSGMGTTAVTNTLGQAVQGNDGGVGNIRLGFKPHQGKTVRYTDAEDQRVMLKLKGPGTIVAFLRTGPDPQPIILLENTYAGRSSLTGSVKPNPGSNGISNLQELAGVSNCDATGVTSNPQFTVTTTQP